MAELYKRLAIISIVVLFSSFVIRDVIAEDIDQKMFVHNQVMKGCFGQQHISRQTTRIVSAVRRCEQAAPLPLKDRALEAIISQLQPSSSNNVRIVYVPVPSFGGGGVPQFQFGNNNNLNPGGFNRFGQQNLGQNLGQTVGGINSGFNNQDRFSDPFNNLQSSSFNNLPSSSFNNQGSTFGLNTNTGRPDTTNNNPFGFNLGKQTSDEPSSLIGESSLADKLNTGAGEAKSRQARQIPNISGARFQQTKLDALYYLSNMTCILRAASFIDHNNLPNYQFYENELRSLQMSRDLRNDMATGLIFCKQLTQCMPVETLNHPLARELGQAIAYSRCLTKASMKACRKEDERRTLSNSRVTGAFFNGNGMELMRSVFALGIDDDSLGFDFF